jgi:hypothetical protein
MSESMVIDISQDLEGITSLSSTNSADKTSGPTQPSALDHTRHTEEIARLKGQLAEATGALHNADSARISSSSSQLQETIDELLIEKANVRDICALVTTLTERGFQA